MDSAWHQWKLWFLLLLQISGKFITCHLSSYLLIQEKRFVHERGFRTAVFNLGVLGGINLAVPIGKH